MEAEPRRRHVDHIRRCECESCANSLKLKLTTLGKREQAGQPFFRVGPLVGNSLGGLALTVAADVALPAAFDVQKRRFSAFRTDVAYRPLVDGECQLLSRQLLGCVFGFA